MTDLTRKLAFGLGLIGALLCWGWVPTAAALCAGPAISLDRAGGPPSAVVVVHGTSFLAGCNDTFGPGQPPVPTPVDRGIRIEFRQFGHAQTLATVDAGQDYTFVAKVTIPPAAVEGSAAEIAAVGSNGSPAQPVTVSGAAGNLAGTGGPAWQLAGAGFLGVAIALLLRLPFRRRRSLGGNV